MRCTQLIGLRQEAKKFLNEQCIKIVSKQCPNCGHSLSEDLKVIATQDASEVGMFDDGPILNTYELKEGGTVKEIIQASQWSSGPCIFLCLEKDGKRLFEWSDKEIYSC